MTQSDTLIQLREAYGLTQRELANRLGMTEEEVSQWERGAAAPSAVHCRRLAELYGVPEEVLLGSEETPGSREAAWAAVLDGKLDKQLRQRTRILRSGKLLIGILVATFLLVAIVSIYRALLAGV